MMPTTSTATIAMMRIVGSVPALAELRAIAEPSRVFVVVSVAVAAVVDAVVVTDAFGLMPLVCVVGSVVATSVVVLSVVTYNAAHIDPLQIEQQKFSIRQNTAARGKSDVP